MPESIVQDLYKILGALANLFASDGNVQAVKILANSQHAIRQTDSDGWNSNEAGYTIYLQVPQQFYHELGGKHTELEQTLRLRAMELSRLYDDEWIVGFVITTELVDDLEWREKAAHWCDMNDDSQYVDGDPEPEPLVISSTTPDQDKFPDLSQIQKAVLKNTSRVRKVVSHTVIKDRNTHQVHHDAITIKTWRKGKSESKIDYDHSVSLTSDGEDEIQKLINFLLTVRNGATKEGSGSYVVVSTSSVPDSSALQKLLNSVSAEGKADAFAAVVQAATNDIDVFEALIKRASQDPYVFAEAGAALNLAAFKSAVIELRALIANTEAGEGMFQKHLQKFPWMFGSEYSELLDRRRWTRDENQDFVVRRTADGYIELIEIKTPLGNTPLFNHDKSHDSYYPAAELSKVLGQVQKYIGKLDASRDSILANDREDTNKIRAKIVIGRDGDESQRAALRTLNGHLHRIEVITFDQLLKIAESVISYLESSLRPVEIESEAF